jgi:protease-4
MLETLPQLYVFETPRDTLHDLLRRMRAAGRDEEIAGVILRVETPAVGWARAQALRAATARLQARGKRVACVLNGGTNLGYYIACGADRIVLHPQGQLLIAGLRAEAIFARGLLDKLGVQADFVQAGKYKGAAEGLTRSEPSDAFARAIQSLLDSYFQQFVQDIAAGRDLSEDAVRALLAEGPYTATQARANGLVDDVGHYDELLASLPQAGRGGALVETDYAADRPGAGASVNVLSLLMGGGSGSAPRHKAPAIAVLYAVGPIVADGTAGTGLADQVVDASSMRKTIRELSADEAIVAVVLRVDSPGGSARASDLIWRELRLLDGEKPVIASFSDTAASGGYYIGAGARRIYANPGTLTGSIGVFGGKLVLSELFGKLGLEVATFEAGKGGGLYSSFQELGPEGRARFQKLIDGTYRTFLERVASTRPDMNTDAVHQVAQGRVWTGRQAHERGLVDELGDLNAAIRRAKTEAGLRADAAVDIVRVPRSRHFVKAILSGGQAQARRDPLHGLPRAVAELAFLRSYLRALMALQHESSVCLTPAAVRVR